MIKNHAQPKLENMLNRARPAVPGGVFSSPSRDRHKEAPPNMRFGIILVLIVLVLIVLSGSAWPKQNSYRTLTTEEMLEMLEQARSDIKSYYFDRQIRGLDIDKRFEAAKQAISRRTSEDEGLLAITAAVSAVNDSHTRFGPPPRPYAVDYGWQIKAVGDSACFVTRVRPDSDAFQKGLRPGDEVRSVNGLPLTRQDIDVIEYGYHVVPQSGLRLVVRAPDGRERSVVAMAAVLPGQAVIRTSDMDAWFERPHNWVDRSQYSESQHVLFWKLPDFLLEPGAVEGMLARTRKYQTVVLDLRGNPGGAVDALMRMVGGFFAEDVKVADFKFRDGSKPEIAKSRGQKAFSGKLIVLIDSKSASAAEVFARLVQLEKRGLVLGDRSRGAVMQGKLYPHAIRLDTAHVARYTVEVSTANMIMSDGKSLENAGVVPDERILPSQADLAGLRDPVLAKAAELAGVKMTPEEAGKVFPVEWPKERAPEIN